MPETRSADGADAPGPSFLQRWSAWVFLALALPSMILINALYPNLHAPDDSDHVKRAYTLFHAPLAVRNTPGRSSGAMIDDGLLRTVADQFPVIAMMVPEEVPPSRFWLHRQTFSDMPGAITYFPLLYLPQSIALEAGDLAGLSVGSSVRLARFANGSASIAICFLALRLLTFGHALVLALLLLPRTLLQFASNSADPLLYGISLLVLAWGMRSPLTTRSGSLFIVGGLAIASAVRPPVAALGLVPLVRAVRDRRWLTAIAVAAAVCVAAGWILWIMPQLADRRCPTGGPPLTDKLFLFLSGAPALIGHTLTENGGFLVLSFIGHFGWGEALKATIDYPLPGWMYLVWAGLLMLAFITDLVSHVRIDGLTRLTLIAAATGSLLLTFLAMFMVCTQANATFVAGLQGRYFVPVLFAAAPVIAGLIPLRGTLFPRLFVALLTAATVTTIAGLLVAEPLIYPAPHAPLAP